MSEIVTGSEEDKRALADQLQRLHDMDFVVVHGSLARAAMYQTLQYPDAPDWPTRTGHPYVGYPPVHRDIDVVLPFGSEDSDFARLRTLYDKPHIIDDFLNTIFDHPGGYQVGDHWAETRGLDPRVFETRTRYLDGMPVRTFTLGTQYMIEQLWHKPPKYAESFERFVRFVYWAAADHPDEFLPADFYEPLRQASMSGAQLLPAHILPSADSTTPPRPRPVHPQEVITVHSPWLDEVEEYGLPEGGGAAVFGRAPEELDAGPASVRMFADSVVASVDRMPGQEIQQVVDLIDERIVQVILEAAEQSSGRLAAMLAELQRARMQLGAVQQLDAVVREEFRQYLDQLGVQWPAV